MADALAISAAVVQFLDIAIRLTLQLSNLYKEIRDVPEKLQRLKTDLDQQVAIAKYVQSSHASFWHGSSAASAVSMPLDQPLADYIVVMEQLLDTVQTIAKSDAGIIRRSWNALRATQKCKEAITLCDALERKKSNITMWLSTANMELSVGIKRLVEGVETKVDRNLQLAQILERTSLQQDQQISRIPALVELSHNTHSAVTELGDVTSSSRQQLLAFAANTDTHVQSLVKQWQELAPTLSEFRDIVQQSTYLQKSIRQVALNTKDIFAQSCISDDPETETVSLTNIPRRKNACTCREITRVTESEPLSFLHFRKVFRRYHYRHCPRSRSSATSFEYLVKIVPPTWLLSQTINVGLSLQFWNARNSWKISPLVTGGARLVNSAKSPAFKAIRNLRNLDQTGLMLQPTHIKELSKTLEDLLKSDQASVFDEDSLGNTILYAILDLYVYRLTTWANCDPCAPEFFSLIHFLLDNGSDPNVHRQANESCDEMVLGMMPQYVGGTLLDIYADRLVLGTSNSSMDLLVYERLLDSDTHFSRPLAFPGKVIDPEYRFAIFDKEVKLLEIEDQAEVCDLTDLMIAIIRQNEADYTKAMKKGNIHQASLANGVAAVHLAIFWPWALRRLIEAGANVNCEDSLGRRPIHLATACRQDEAVIMLLEADCSLLTPDYSRSLLQESLRQGRTFEHISSRIVHALLDRHTRLNNLALSVLPNSSNLTLQSTQCSLAEKEAPKVIDTLIRYNCHVPPSLQMDRDGEGVHDTADARAYERLTPTLADQLWGGGFHRVDDPSHATALTPILQNWHAANFDMVSWFIGKGASPFSRSPDKFYSGLHLYAARMSWPGHHFDHNPSNLPCPQALFGQLINDADMWRDRCRCLCSPDGCTPISITIKQWPGWNKAVNYNTMLDLSRSLHEKLLYRPDDEPDHIHQLSRVLVFEKLNLKHSCCHIGLEGQTGPWWPWKLEGKRDYCSLEAEYRRSHTECTSRMLRCGCATMEKPVCAVFREECENRH